MLWQVFIAGFILGVISSFHCVGMCGPLALSLPLAHYSPGKKIIGIMLYNFGRVTTYAVLGLIFGYLGRQVVIAGFQQAFSVTAGMLILFFFLLSLFRKKPGIMKPVASLYTKIQLLVAGFLRLQNPAGLFLTGMANGLLPCGMVYLALTGAMAAANIGYSSAFMAAFGAGTMPAMLLLSLAGMMISLRARNFFRKLTPYAFLLMSLLLILRGLNLGIPFISPSLATNSVAVTCH